MKTITCCFNKEEPTERAMETAGKDHYLGAPTTGNTLLPTLITAGASIALYSENKDWELINTGRGRLVASTHPKHQAGHSALPHTACFIWSQGSLTTECFAPHPVSLLKSLHHYTFPGRPRVKTDTLVLYIPYTDLFQVISLITPQLLYLSKNQCLVGEGTCATMSEVRRHPAGTRSLLPLCGLQESSSGRQAWCQVSLPAEPSCQPFHNYFRKIDLFWSVNYWWMFHFGYLINRLAHVSFSSFPKSSTIKMERIFDTLFAVRILETHESGAVYKRGIWQWFANYF